MVVNTNSYDATEYSKEVSRSFVLFNKRVSKALDTYYKHLYEKSNSAVDDYIHEIENAANEHRRRLEELKSNYPGLLHD